MICKPNPHYIGLNKHKRKKGLLPVNRRHFCKWAATSSIAFSMPWFFGCNPGNNDVSDSGGEDSFYYKRPLWNDTRAEISVDPHIELQDYSGPFKADLKYTDFSREQLSNMLTMVHHYHHAIQKAYRDYAYNKFGYEGVLESEENLWKKMMWNDFHRIIKNAMNINGKNLEAFMKSWQIDLNSLPGDHCEVIFEMPSRRQGIVTFNRCPLVAEYEANERIDELHDVCMTRCAGSIEKRAQLFDVNIGVRTIAIPPRQSENHICCKFELYYRSQGGQLTEDVNLEIDPDKWDVRGELLVSPDIELNDYSGQFRPDLRLTDFSRKQLARMYLSLHKYNFAMLKSYGAWCKDKLGYENITTMHADVWNEALLIDARKIMARHLNTPERGIDSFLKALQVDIVLQPPSFDINFEMQSEDHCIITFNKCYAVTVLELLGQEEQMEKCCGMDMAVFERSATIFDPDLKFNVLQMLPRPAKDSVCCKWEVYY